MRVEEKQLKAFIEDSRLVSKKDVELAEKEAKKTDSSIGKSLVASGKLTEDELRRIQAHVLGIPYVSLAREKIAFEVLSLIPEPIARNHNIVAYRMTDKGLEVAMLDVDDIKAIDFVKKKVGARILPRLTDADSIKNVLLQYQKSLKAEFGDLIKKDTESLKAVTEKTGETENATEAELKELAQDLPIVRIVDTLIKHAILEDASDIHIEPQEEQMVVRYRIDGILHDAMTLPKNAAPGITARVKVLASLKLDEKRLPQDGRFKVDTGTERVSFRVSTLPTYFGEKTVMRLLREHSKGFTLEGLGFHGEGLERIIKATKQTTGMILTTGPTGSGKTTTLYTILDILNTIDVNISTIEDPIEYQMPRVNQTQVKSDIGLTFESGLRTLVRQDPDVIMVGEIRDTETASLAVNAALTGHLVLSTLHTNSAAGAVPRLIDMRIEPFLLVSTIKVIIGQRLVRLLVGEKETYRLSKAEIKDLGSSVDLDRMLSMLRAEKVVPENATWESVPFYKPKPTDENPDGYRGRKGIHEIMQMSETVKELILSGASTDKIDMQARSEGMMSMLEDGIFKAVQGVTTIEEVFRVITE